MIEVFVKVAGVNEVCEHRETSRAKEADTLGLMFATTINGVSSYVAGTKLELLVNLITSLTEGDEALWDDLAGWIAEECKLDQQRRQRDQQC